MTNITVYYDDTKKKCRDYINFLEIDEKVVCKKATEYKDKQIIFEENSRVGFVFESDKEKVPFLINHIIWRIVMDKKGCYFIVVLGGNRELSALKMAALDLKKRGYTVTNGFTQYLFERYKVDSEESAKRVIEKIENADPNKALIADLELLKNESRRNTEVRRKIRREAKLYISYRKKNRKSVRKAV